VVGVDSQVATNQNDIAQADGVSFAVPVDTARNVVQQLASHGEVRYPNLGNFGYGIATKTASLSPTDKGAVAAKVAPDSPAQKASIRVGDLVSDTGELQALISKHQVGPRVTLKIVEGSQTAKVSVTPDNRPQHLPS
jgi:S1-C subfamily serine protease